MNKAGEKNKTGEFYMYDGWLKGNFAIFYMLAKYVPGDKIHIFTEFYQHISTNNKANRKFVIFFMGCDDNCIVGLKFKVWVADVKFASFKALI